MSDNESNNDKWGKLDENLRLKDTPVGKEYYERLIQLRQLLESQVEIEKQKLINAKVQIHKIKSGGGK